MYMSYYVKVQCWLARRSYAGSQYTRVYGMLCAGCVICCVLDVWYAVCWVCGMLCAGCVICCVLGV